MTRPEPRFRLDRELGAGTTGRVWHGVLAEGFGGYPAGFEVAVKYLHAHLEADPGAVDAFEAEARAARAASHPSLAQGIHSGRDARGRYLLMTFVPGRSLREVLAASGALPEPLVRAVVRQVAGGLAALHAAGFAHGDVKPENVRLDAEGNAVLLDLGFAHVPAEADHAAPPRRGSLPYLAPEQARGALGDERSDVFSLAVVAYELATGVHPFGHGRADGRAAGQARRSASSRWLGSSGAVARAALERPDGDRLIAAIASARFVAPSRVAPQISPFLDRLLEDALQRDPARRPTAAELALRLSEQESSAWWRAEIGFEAGARRGGAGERDATHALPLVGREGELAALEAAFASAVRGEGERPYGGAAWVRGEAGSGKSRLASELASRARRSDDPPLYLYGRCRELEEGRPCEPVLRLLERYLRLPQGVVPGERERAELEKLVPPSTAQTLAGALDPGYEGATPLAVPVALATWITSLGRAVPLLLFLDDVNWAAEDTLEVLSRAAEKLAGTRTLLVLGQRAGAGVRRPEALAALRAKLRAVPLTEVELAPLDEEAVSELVTELFHHSTPRLRLASALWDRSRGNPGLIGELLRSLSARGQVRAHPDGTGLVLSIAPDELPLPGSLHKAISESYRGLPAGDRTWLRRLAVVGGRIETEFLLRAFPDAKRADVDLVLARLVRSGWLVPSGSRYRFKRPALREAVYRGLTREQRVRLHAAAAAALAPAEGAASSLEDAFQRAFHLRASQDRETLLGVIEALLARLLRVGQPQRVHALATWGLEALDAMPRTRENERRRIALLEAAVDAADRLGFRRGQRELLDRLADLEIDPELDPQAVGRVYLLHGRYAVSTGQYGLARGWLRNAVSMFERADSLVELAEALRRLSLVQSHVGELAEARALSTRALELSQHDAQRALAHLAIGVIDVLEDRIEPALVSAERALAALRSDPRFRLPGVWAAAYMLRARVYRIAGSPARALASANRAIELARVAGERRLEAEASARLGGLLLDVDRAAEAEARLREALLLAEEIEDRRGQALARLFLGILLWEDDDPEAEAMLVRTVELASEMGLNRVEALAAAIEARVRRERGDLDAALARSARASELLEQVGAELADRIVIGATRALLLRTSGRGEEADAIESDLRERIAERRERIASPLLRMRHQRSALRLLEAALSPEGPIYPRVRLSEEALRAQGI